MELDRPQDALEEELAIAIARARCGTGAGKMSRELLSRESYAYSLVGLRADGERTVFYERLRGPLTTAPFDRDGVDGTASNQVDRLENTADRDRSIQDHAPVRLCASAVPVVDGRE